MTNIEINGMDEETTGLRPAVNIRYTGTLQSVTPTIGELYFDVITNEYKVWNGNAWVLMAPLNQPLPEPKSEVIDDEYGVTVKRLKEIALSEAINSDDEQIKELINKLLIHVKLKHDDTLKSKCEAERPRNLQDVLIGGFRLTSGVR